MDRKQRISSASPSKRTTQVRSSRADQTAEIFGARPFGLSTLGGIEEENESDLGVLETTDEIFRDTRAAKSPEPLRPEATIFEPKTQANPFIGFGLDEVVSPTTTGLHTKMTTATQQEDWASMPPPPRRSSVLTRKETAQPARMSPIFESPLPPKHAREEEERSELLMRNLDQQIEGALLTDEYLFGDLPNKKRKSVGPEQGTLLDARRQAVQDDSPVRGFGQEASRRVSLSLTQELLRGLAPPKRPQVEVEVQETAEQLRSPGQTGGTPVATRRNRTDMIGMAEAVGGQVSNTAPNPHANFEVLSLEARRQREEQEAIEAAKKELKAVLEETEHWRAKNRENQERREMEAAMRAKLAEMDDAIVVLVRQSIDLQKELASEPEPQVEVGPEQTLDAMREFNIFHSLQPFKVVKKVPDGNGNHMSTYVVAGFFKMHVFWPNKDSTLPVKGTLEIGNPNLYTASFRAFLREVAASMLSLRPGPGEALYFSVPEEDGMCTFQMKCFELTLLKVFLDELYKLEDEQSLWELVEGFVHLKFRNKRALLAAQLCVRVQPALYPHNPDCLDFKVPVRFALQTPLDAEGITAALKGVQPGLDYFTRLYNTMCKTVDEAPITR